MFEDEMTEDQMVRTDDEYRRLTAQEIEEEKLAQAKAQAAGLAGWASAISSKLRETPQ